jgi:hypothetical protein
MKLVLIGAHLRRDDVEPLAAAIACGEIWLSGVEVPDDQPLGDRDLLLRVADVRARLLDCATFIAIRYGFAATPDAAAAACASHAERWRRVLDASRDNVEMTIKVAANDPKPRPRREDFANGAGYLRALHANAAEVDPRFREAVSGIATHRWSHRDGRSLECALLVRRGEVGRVREQGEQLKRDFPNTPFLLSGPWPLEVFVD